MKITIGNYTIETDTFNYTVTKQHPYINKDGENKVRVEYWYYPKPEQAFIKVFDEMLKDGDEFEDVKSLIKYIESSKKEIVHILEQIHSYELSENS